MPSITALLRSLGNDGALDNVSVALEERRREEWLVASLCHRLAERDRVGEAATATPSAPAVRATHAA